MKAALKISGYTVETFGDKEKIAFSKAIANIAEVSETAVRIKSVEQALLSVIVRFSIAAANSDIGYDVVKKLISIKPVGPVGKSQNCVNTTRRPERARRASNMAEAIGRSGVMCRACR